MVDQFRLDDMHGHAIMFPMMGCKSIGGIQIFVRRDDQHVGSIERVEILIADRCWIRHLIPVFLRNESHILMKARGRYEIRRRAGQGVGHFQRARMVGHIPDAQSGGGSAH